MPRPAYSQHDYQHRSTNLRSNNHSSSPEHFHPKEASGQPHKPPPFPTTTRPQTKQRKEYYLAPMTPEQANKQTTVPKRVGEYLKHFFRCTDTLSTPPPRMHQEEAFTDFV
ncbi:hypothetical protein CC80DRAFT_532662 [Byssothecium circinans]|uniref:Uncharacterized protein n=1 Tax=Byssothecium circinans TaxID=147558 RepID=A0A6A5UGB9_9PLEO|nr:hypothetical protein CC80DRAFT_532662 [Byssothecium circinans]